MYIYPFSREAIGHLDRWAAETSRKPLIVRGARQVGKSTLVDMFSRKYRRVARLNLEKPGHADLFRRDLSLQDTVQAILLECRTPPGPDPLLLFLDEIQEVPEAVALLRYFHEERPDIHVVAAGSLLEVAMEEEEAISFPVGRVQFLYLRPLSFQEFLMAQGESAALDALRTIPAPAFAHERLLDLFRRYTMVGGMPEAVGAYAQSGGELGPVHLVYADLFRTFQDDIGKYGKSESQRRILLHCLDTAPFLAGSRVTFQGFGGSDYRSREVGEALRTLERAMLLDLVHPTTGWTDPVIPDLRKSPRLQFLDVGLVSHRAGLQRQLLEARDLSETHRGRVVEQVIGQEFKTIALREDLPLAFWVRDKAQSQAEVDFLIRSARGLVPVEAKSGAAGKLRSLHQYMIRSGSRLAVRLYGGPASLQDVEAHGASYRLLNVPYYAASLVDAYIAESDRHPGAWSAPSKT